MSRGGVDTETSHARKRDRLTGMHLYCLSVEVRENRGSEGSM